MKAFSYFCKNDYKRSCKYLLTILITSQNYEPGTYKLLSPNGAFQSSKEGH